MPKIAYITKRFNASTEKVVQQAVSILEEYAAVGLVITLRQL